MSQNLLERILPPLLMAAGMLAGAPRDVGPKQPGKLLAGAVCPTLGASCSAFEAGASVSRSR